MPALGLSEFFHDSAVGKALANLNQPANFLVVGLLGVGKRQLLANLREAQPTDNLFAAPSSPNFVAAPAPADAARPSWQLTVGRARCTVLHLGGQHRKMARKCRRLLGDYLQYGRAAGVALPPEDGAEGHEDGGATKMEDSRATVHSVLFVVDLANLSTLDEARAELNTLAEMQGLWSAPLAVFFNRPEEEADCFVEEWEFLRRSWVEGAAWEGPVKMFDGSIEERTGYGEAFNWLVGFLE